MYNTSVSMVPREMFHNAEKVRNVTIDIHESEMKTVHNPSNSYKPGVPGKRFLMSLRIKKSHVKCDCDIG